MVNQVESRLNAEIAVEQHALADSSRKDNASMKTLTLLGAVFLPGTFLSSLFSTPFFEFHGMSPLEPAPALPSSFFSPFWWNVPTRSLPIHGQI